MTSARSIPTGPGSRGGRSHLPGGRAAISREFRARDADYRERERTRLRNRRAKLREQRDAAAITFTEALREMVADEVQGSSLRRVAAALAVSHTTVLRIVHGSRPGPDVVDALIDHFGVYRVVAGFRSRVRARRAAA